MLGVAMPRCPPVKRSPAGPATAEQSRTFAQGEAVEQVSTALGQFHGLPDVAIEGESYRRRDPRPSLKQRRPPE
jgi:hypothetical protein